ncbi:helix-turn-helix transcriptional regulator [Cohnella yongneupensis]|uniref:Helix-turn-helix transcriptional regulator n=1 Tax=Cohnella yongneupensis TaxID=425006 RepID=A0ABW0R209_9BACL
MNMPSVLLDIPQLASWCDWTGIDPLPISPVGRSCLVWLRSGSAEARSAQHLLTLKEGMFLFVPPNAEMALQPPPGLPLRAIVFYVANLRVQGLPPGLLTARELPFVIPVKPDHMQFKRVLEDILYEARTPQLGSQDIISSLLRTLIIHCLRELATYEHPPDAPVPSAVPVQPAQSPESSRARNQENGFSVAQNVKVYIEQHYDLELSLSDLAQQVFVSPYHLAHVFKEEVGMSPIQYLIKCRIDEAKRLLIETEQSVRDIALKVGYPNANYFNLLFSKMTGHSPGKYRKHK